MKNKKVLFRKKKHNKSFALVNEQRIVFIFIIHRLATCNQIVESCSSDLIRSLEFGSQNAAKKTPKISFSCLILNFRS